MTESIKRNKKHISGANVATHIVLVIFSFLSVFPFYWIVVSSTNNSNDVVQARLYPGANLGVNLYGLLTDNQNLDLVFMHSGDDAEADPTATKVETVWDFLGIIGSSKIVTAFWNSLRNTLLITAGSLLVSSAAGYAFVVYRTKGKEIILKLIMLSMMIPAAATLIPLFRMFSKIGLTNNYWGVVIPAFSTAFLIFMFRQGAQSFPRELIEASRIDGLSEFGIFTRVFMPVMKPTYSAAATVTFMNSWNSYLWPLVILAANPQNHTMPMYISNLMGGYVLDFGQIMLAVTITTIPTVVIFFMLQKNFVEGILGSVKQ